MWIIQHPNGHYFTNYSTWSINTSNLKVWYNRHLAELANTYLKLGGVVREYEDAR